jgi:hypothetical protein
MACSEDNIHRDYSTPFIRKGMRQSRSFINRKMNSRRRGLQGILDNILGDINATADISMSHVVDTKSIVYLAAGAIVAGLVIKMVKVK